MINLHSELKMIGPFSELKVKYEYKARVDNLVFRLHYRYTASFFFACAILSTLYDFVGDKIICMLDTNKDDPMEDVVNSYCYITGTYTVDKLHYSGIEMEVPHPGVGPHRESDAITYHSYYQWVPFVLVAQGAMFYLPHYIWKTIEKGLFKTIIQKLSFKDYLENNLSNYVKRTSQFELLAVYIRQNFGSHKWWAYKYIFCEFLNFLTTIVIMYTTNIFLGGEFTTYGTEVISVSNMDPENRTDPMAQVFPQMGKCIFKFYGPSGTVEKRDVMCLLPTNVANEKIYIALWFWLLFMFFVGAAWMAVRFISMLRFVREPVLKFRVLTLPQKNTNRPQSAAARKELEALSNGEDIEEDENKMADAADIRRILNAHPSFSDFVLFCQLGDNMEISVFSEFMHYLADQIEKNSNSNRSSSFNDSGVQETEFDGNRKLNDLGNQGGAYPHLSDSDSLAYA